MRVIIVDDEALSRTRLRQLLRGERDIEILAECSTGADAVDAVERLRPDVMFLDVQMPEMDGFEVLASLADSFTPLVIFVTAFDEYAVKAFDVLALDYVLKPVAPERLHAACERARARLTQPADAVATDDRLLSLLTQLHNDGRVQRPVASNRLFVRANDRVVMLNPDDIHWCEAAGNYVKIHVHEQTYVVRQPLSEMEALLNPAVFARIHRSTIVNLDHVKEFQPWFSGEMIVLMHDGTKLKLSRTYRQEFENRHRILS
jgi:two-component system, LytTR family, response regulator